MNFWSIDIEKKFFDEALKNFASPEKLFYKLEKGYFAYIPKGENAEGQTLQSRNSLIGQYTEKWAKDFFQPIAKSAGLYAINNVVCPQLGLTVKSDADLAFCTTEDTHQEPENIKLLFEVKMSIINNYRYSKRQVMYVGDYKSHKGSPSILRSDSMLKAIGKSLNIRVSGKKSARIPILVLGNSPIAESYKSKVDFLKKAGMIQGFLSVYPSPCKDCVHETAEKGFLTFDKYNSLRDYILTLLDTDIHFFSSMLPKKRLGQIISIADREKSDISKAEKFLILIEE